MPVSVISSPTRVVDSKELSIDEYAGNGSNGEPQVSIARVTSKGTWTEDWKTPQFDEWVLVLRGTIKLHHSDGVAVAKAGEMLRLTAGTRVQWEFPDPEGCEYVPVCLPGFSPDKVSVEAGTGVPLHRTTHSEHKALYHLVQEELWTTAKATGATYYPPTYDSEKFTHATANPAFLLSVANHFYKDVGTKWLCLEMTAESLAAAGVQTVFEMPAPVGDKASLNSADYGGELFPHLYGGIPATPGVVMKEYTVHRAEDGTFLSIDGLSS